MTRHLTKFTLTAATLAGFAKPTAAPPDDDPATCGTALLALASSSYLPAGGLVGTTSGKVAAKKA